MDLEHTAAAARYITCSRAMARGSWSRLIFGFDCRLNHPAGAAMHDYRLRPFSGSFGTDRGLAFATKAPLAASGVYLAAGRLSISNHTDHVTLINERT